MTHHAHDDNHHDHAGLAELLDLDAELFGPGLDQVTAWVAQHAPDEPRAIVDIGAGTGTGTLALARRFGTAEVVALDKTPLMLDRVRAAARAHGLADRVRAVAADLDLALPDVGPVDLAWAALSLHEVADPDRLLRQMHAAMKPGATVVVVEMGGPPRFLPDDPGVGRPGLEERFDAAILQAGWNTHPDWEPYLERAGFELAEHRDFAFDAVPAGPSAGRYAHGFMTRLRAVVDDRLESDDLAALDLLLADGPQSLLRRDDLQVRGSRTGWAARRP